MTKKTMEPAGKIKATFLLEEDVNNLLLAERERRRRAHGRSREINLSALVSEAIRRAFGGPRPGRRGETEV